MSRKGCCDDCSCGCPLGYEAEAQIAALKTDCMRLQQEINSLRMEPCQLEGCVSQKARIERLEGALRKIVDYPETFVVSPEGHMRVIAKQALSDVKPFECNCEDLRSCRDLYGNKHGAVDEMKKRKEQSDL